MEKCCANPENCILLSSASGGVVTVKGQSHVAKTTIQQCTVCKRKHYGMEVEPMKLKAKAG